MPQVIRLPEIMYAYIRGKLTYKTPTTVHLDVGGVGYLIHISLYTYGKIESLEEASLYTYLHVKEDILAIYGFFEEAEKELFIQLLSVTGIGPNTARIILSSMSPLEVRTAIVTDNDLAFKKVKGVGPKTAKRIILDLKDKIKSGSAISHEHHLSTSQGSVLQAVEALVALGFQKQKVEKVISALPDQHNLNVENLIKQALQKLT